MKTKEPSTNGCLSFEGALVQFSSMLRFCDRQLTSDSEGLDSNPTVKLAFILQLSIKSDQKSLGCF